MNKLILALVSALGLMQTACEMKIASDNVVNAPNSSVFGPGSIPPFGGSAAPLTVGSLPTVSPLNNNAIPAGTTTVGNGSTPTTPAGTVPMVPIKIASVPLSPALSDVQKSNFVRSSIQNTFANKTVSTFQSARNPSSVSFKVTQPAIKTASLVPAARGREPKSEVANAVESAR